MSINLIHSLKLSVHFLYVSYHSIDIKGLQELLVIFIQLKAMSKAQIDGKKIQYAT